MMDDKIYMQTQNRMAELGRELEQLDCNGFMDRLSFADACAPLVDPALYKDARPNIQAIMQLAMACVQVQTAMARLRFVVGQAVKEGKMSTMREKTS